jgi:transposase
MSIIGIDVSKAKLDCAYLSEAGKVKTKVVANNSQGWQELMTWAQNTTKKETLELHFVMEATGIYHENLATWLHNNGAKVSIVNPAYVKYYAQSLGTQSKNDKKDSIILARYGNKEKAAYTVRNENLKSTINTLDCYRKRLAT